MRPAILVCRKEPAVPPHSRANVRERASRRIDPLRTIESPAGARHSEDCERVPRDEHLFVSPGMNPPLARGEEFRARRIEQRTRRLIERTRDAQVPMLALEIRPSIESPMGPSDVEFARIEEPFHFRSIPDVE